MSSPHPQTQAARGTGGPPAGVRDATTGRHDVRGTQRLKGDDRASRELPRALRALRVLRGAPLTSRRRGAAEDGRAGGPAGALRVFSGVGAPSPEPRTPSPTRADGDSPIWETADRRGWARIFLAIRVIRGSYLPSPFTGRTGSGPFFGEIALSWPMNVARKHGPDALASRRGAGRKGQSHFVRRTASFFVNSAVPLTRRPKCDVNRNDRHLRLRDQTRAPARLGVCHSAESIPFSGKTDQSLSKTPGSPSRSATRPPSYRRCRSTSFGVGFMRNNSQTTSVFLLPSPNLSQGERDSRGEVVCESFRRRPPLAYSGHGPPLRSPKLPSAGCNLCRVLRRIAY